MVAAESLQRGLNDIVLHVKLCCNGTSTQVGATTIDTPSPMCAER
jgi:hypothetical protein